MDNDLLPDEDQDLQLTSTQEQQIVDLWNKTPGSPPSLKQLTQELFQGDFDGRSKEGRAIKAFLASRQLRAKATSDSDKRPEIELSEAHKLYITNNAATQTAVEMARILFHNIQLTNLNAETRAVNSYMKTLDTKVVFNAHDMQDVPEGNYEPPNTFDKVFKKVNSYINFSLDKNRLTAFQRKGLDMLINYLHTYRFVHQMNTFDSEADRKLAEDAFIRATYDKPDLAQEEVDQYIEYANQVVQGAKVLRRHLQLQNMLEKRTSGTADDESMKISMSLVEAIGKASTEYNQCKIRENKLLSDLKQKRSERMSKQVSENASMLNFVQQWKMEESRLEWIRQGELEQEEVGKEIERITSLPDLKARIFGLVKDEIKNT